MYTNFGPQRLIMLYTHLLVTHLVVSAVYFYKIHKTEKNIARQFQQFVSKVHYKKRGTLDNTLTCLHLFCKFVLTFITNNGVHSTRFATLVLYEKLSIILWFTPKQGMLNSAVLNDKAFMNILYFIWFHIQKV